MGTVSSGIGLISGLDIQSTVTQLMALERRPITLVERQIQRLSAQRAAFMNISAQVLSLKMAVTPLRSGVTFRPNIAASSAEGVLTAQASSSAVPGQYTFTVLQTAQTHQMVSQGFNDPNRTAIGAGTISMEMGQGNLDRNTELSLLRNQQGIRRGQIRITDRSGSSAQIDLSSAITVSDVLKKINEAGGINVQASVDGDRIVLTDLTGSALGNLTVQDVNNGFTAQDLGIAGSVSSESITGDDLVGVTHLTALRFLNDGNGIRTNGYGDDLKITLRDGSDFNIDLNSIAMDSSLNMLNNGQGVRPGSILATNRAGASAEIDLSGAQTLNDVVTAIRDSGLSLDVSLVGGSKLMILDSSGGTGPLKIENVGETSTATDLGLAMSVDTGAMTGSELFQPLTLGDMKRAIEDAARRAGHEGKIQIDISPDGKGLMLTDSTGGGGPLVVESLSRSKAAQDLGIAGTFSSDTLVGSRLIAGLNTVLLRNLNGGSGVAAGSIEIQDRSGQTAQIDLSAAQTLQEVLDAINAAPNVNVKAELNSAKTGIVIHDLTGAGAANFKITDLNSTTAQDLKILADTTAERIDSNNNQLQYISENTLLSKLNGGNGLSAGSFTITDSSGRRGTVTLTAEDISKKTMGDLLQMISVQAGVGVTASINANGDGISITDTAEGTGTLTIANVGSSSTASELNIAKQASSPGSGSIEGSFEYRIDVGGSDTLQTLAAKINAMKGPFTAGIINDGTGVNAYRLTLTSKNAGTAGRIIFNSGQTSLMMYDLAEAKDAMISLGSGGGASIVATSNKNTFTNVIPGLTLEAKNASATPVTITVSQDVDSVVAKLKDFVDKFNAILNGIKTQTKYDPETKEAGALLSNMQIETVKNRLYNAVTASLEDVGGIRRLSELGIRIGTDAKLEFTEDKFREVFAANPKEVENFFSTSEKGMGHLLDKVTDELTRSYDGLITRTMDSYDSRTKLLNDRIKHLEVMYAKKEERLYRQFQAMEMALSKMQGMQAALLSYTPIDPITTKSGGF